MESEDKALKNQHVLRDSSVRKFLSETIPYGIRGLKGYKKKFFIHIIIYGDIHTFSAYIAI